MSVAKQTCGLSKISNIAPNPVQMFQNIIDKVEQNPVVMNLATVDKEFGVLNRSVVYRGLSKENHPKICFVTEKSSRKCQNLQENPKLSITIVCPLPEELWQIRIFNAEAHELNHDAVKEFWQNELLFSKIRSHISECGKPADVQELESKCRELVEKYNQEGKEPDQTETYTAFKVVPKLWDFYKSEPLKIADRVQYKLVENENDKWEVYHVNA